MASPRLLRHVWSLRKDVVGAAAQWSGLGRVFEAVARPTGAVVLMYHSVALDELASYVDPENRLSPNRFAAQMALLKRSRRVVSLSELVDQISSGATPARGTVCITFDDGYLDNLTVVAPILQRYRLPATLFLATGYVERVENQWADTLHWAFERRTTETFKSLDGTTIQLASKAARVHLRRSLHRVMLNSNYAQRTSILSEVREQLRPNGREHRLTLSWDDVRTLVRQYPFFEIGGHTRDHISLGLPRDASEGEISGCKDDIRRELGYTPRHFSYPYGRWCSEARNMVRASGWRSAVAAGKDVRIRGNTDCFAIARIDTPQTLTDLSFKTSGAYPGLLSALGMH